MGKEKSTYSNKNNREPRKSRLCAEDKLKNKSKRTMKSVKNQTKRSAKKFDLDSLEYLRDTTKRNELNDIDERIKLLKAKLMTLFSGKTIDNTSGCSTSAMIDSESCNLQNPHCLKKLKTSVLESDLVESKENCEDSNSFQIDKKNFKPVFISTPAKFSGQMMEATCIKTFSDTKEQKAKNLLNFKSEVYQKSAATFKLNKFDVSLLSQQKIEELLYKSFIMQNSKLYFSFHDDSNSECKKSTMKTNKEKFSSFEKQYRYKGNKKYIQQNLNKYCRSTQRGKKRRMIDINSSLSDVEVIDIDSSLCSNIKPKNNTLCIDLDIKDYDWNEPFDLNNTGLPSEPEIIEGCEKKETDETQELKLNNTDLKKAEISHTDENDKSHLKKVWECPVCFEQSKGQEVVATQCGHIFCKKCLENHFSKLTKSCPSCRTNLKNKPFITLFNF